jgi:hypothetical protein
MRKVTNLSHNSAFDPETVEALCNAYDRASKSLHDAGQSDVVNEVIAQRIVALAQQGERDPDKLCAGALGCWPAHCGELAPPLGRGRSAMVKC